MSLKKKVSSYNTIAAVRDRLRLYLIVSYIISLANREGENKYID